MPSPRWAIEKKFVTLQNNLTIFYSNSFNYFFMKHNFTRFLVGCVMTLFGVLASNAAEKAVVVISADGSQRQELLSDVDKIEIGTEALTLVTIGGETSTVPYSDLDRILVGAEYSAIKEITTPSDIAVWPTTTSDRVNISGLAPGSPITVFALNGTQVLAVKASESLTSISLAGLPAGIYILTVDKTAVKIVKQ